MRKGGSTARRVDGERTLWSPVSWIRVRGLGLRMRLLWPLISQSRRPSEKSPNDEASLCALLVRVWSEPPFFLLSLVWGFPFGGDSLKKWVTAATPDTICQTLFQGLCEISNVIIIPILQIR